MHGSRHRSNTQLAGTRNKQPSPLRTFPTEVWAAVGALVSIPGSCLHVPGVPHQAHKCTGRAGKKCSAKNFIAVKCGPRRCLGTCMGPGLHTQCRCVVLRGRKSCPSEATRILAHYCSVGLVREVLVLGTALTAQAACQHRDATSCHQVPSPLPCRVLSTLPLSPPLMRSAFRLAHMRLCSFFQCASWQRLLQRQTLGGVQIQV